MLDVGWSELLLVAVIAIVVIGPKDLPRAMRTVGHWVAKIRATAREFQSNVDEMIREAELDEIRKEADRITSFDLKDQPGARIVSDFDSGNSIAPPPEAEPSDDEAEAEADYAAGAPVAPPHSLTEPEPAAEPGPGDDGPAEERPANRANG
jgi:sec-independent protein translocase protein TatB